LKARIDSMSPVSETTVVQARNCSSLLVMDKPPWQVLRAAIVARPRVIRKRQPPGARQMGADILGGVNPRRDGREDRIPALRKSDRLDWNLMSPSLFLDIINA
jgi:hypothetical protein